MVGRGVAMELGRSAVLVDNKSNTSMHPTNGKTEGTKRLEFDLHRRQLPRGLRSAGIGIRAICCSHFCSHGWLSTDPAIRGVAFKCCHAASSCRRGQGTVMTGHSGDDSNDHVGFDMVEGM
jgi:hypothetical protein